MYHELKHSFDMLSQRLEYAENYGTIVSSGCSGKYWHKRNHKQIPLQHDAQIPCGAWYRGPLYSFLEFGPGGPTRKIHQNNIKYYQHHGASMYHELKHSFDMLSQRLEYAENYGTIVSPGCSGKYWHKRNRKQIPLQHDAQIPCGAWYRGPLYPFLEFGPGGPTRKIHQNNIKYYKHHDPSMYHEFKHSFDMLSPRLEKAENYGTIVSPGCSGKYWHKRNHKQIPLQHDAQRSLVAHGIGAHCTHFWSLGPGVRRARYIDIKITSNIINIMIHRCTMNSNTVLKCFHKDLNMLRIMAW